MRFQQKINKKIGPQGLSHAERTLDFNVVY